MSRTPRDTRDRILSAAYGLLYKERFSRVSVDAIADAAGVTKRTLYYHFDSKDALVAAVLDYQHAFALVQIQEWASESAETPATFLAELFAALGVWARESRWLGSGFTRLTMELADLPGHPARRAAHYHKAAVEDWLTGRLAARGARRPEELAREVMLLTEGCLSLILIHGDPGYAEAGARAAVRLANRNTV